DSAGECVWINLSPGKRWWRLVLQRDLGSLRVPPTVSLVSSILLFALGLLALHWREKDEAAVKKRAEAPEGDAPADPTPEPANA
ncbi:MAG: hypothetical protein R6X23_00060, partial [Acidimicrobiia bacterium]